MTLPKASCISITASAARRRSSIEGCFITMPLMTKKISRSRFNSSQEYGRRLVEAKRVNRASRYEKSHLVIIGARFLMREAASGRKWRTEKWRTEKWRTEKWQA